MGKRDKLIERILRGNADADIPFADLCGLLRGIGFAERVRGSHRIFTKDDVEEIINLQPTGDTAKPYQVKQVPNLLLRYRLGGDNV